MYSLSLYWDFNSGCNDFDSNFFPCLEIAYSLLFILPWLNPGCGIIQLIEFKIIYCSELERQKEKQNWTLNLIMIILAYVKSCLFHTYSIFCSGLYFPTYTLFKYVLSYLVSFLCNLFFCLHKCRFCDWLV